jgi:hypothetical protein
MAWTRKSHVGRAFGVVEGVLDGQVTLLQPVTGEYAGLGSTAAHVGELLDPPPTLGRLVGALPTAYDVPRAECAATSRSAWKASAGTGSSA